MLTSSIDPLGPVHTNPDISESATFSFPIRLGTDKDFNWFRNSSVKRRIPGARFFVLANLSRFYFLVTQLFAPGSPRMDGVIRQQAPHSPSGLAFLMLIKAIADSLNPVGISKFE